MRQPQDATAEHTHLSDAWPTAAERYQLLAARTMPPVAVADDRSIGRLSAGPSFFLCAQMAMQGPSCTRRW
ncbi:hypothetical protein [Nocardia sputorum]|uniref:hypothetical protein n=1 Tax=Nocardia sputorum TaxID=2984338 RepID=UPI002493AEFA|nr:hypothetical protein [Nocardia sputorum]